MTGGQFAPGLFVGQSPSVFPPSSLQAYEWVWADAAARLAEPVNPAMVGGRGRQIDIRRDFQLLDNPPLQWGKLPDPALAPLRGMRGILAQAATSLYGFAFTGTIGARGATAGSKSGQLARVAVPTTAVAGTGATYRTQGSSEAWQAAQGMRWIMRSVPGAVSASMRWFTGYTTTTPLLTNVDPATFLSCLGIGSSGAADVNLQLYHNDGAGAAVKLDLGINFPSKTLNFGYEIEVWTVDGTSYAYQVRALNGLPEVATSGILTVEIPAATILGNWTFYGANNADAVIVSNDAASLEVGSIV